MHIARTALVVTSLLATSCSRGGADRDTLIALDARVAALENADQAPHADDAPPVVETPPVETPPAGEPTNADVIERLDRIEKKVDALDEAVSKSSGTAQVPKRRGPDPDKVYSIPITGSPGQGADKPLVAITIATEFACPACERERPFIDDLLAEFKGKAVRIVYKNFIVHPTRATIPAQAACAADLQGKYTEYAAALWEGFKARKFDGNADDLDDVIAIAKDVGLDVDRLKRDLGGPCKNFVQEEHDAMRKIGVGGTPTFFINGRLLEQRTVDRVKEMVEEELEKARKAIKAGEATKATYYEKVIVGKGATSM